MSQPSDQPPETELSTALIAGLAVQAGKLTDAAENLRAAYRFSRQMRFIILVAFLMIVGLVVIALQNNANGKATRDATATIQDCTTPGGRCYDRGQNSTGQAVAQIVAEVNAHTDLVFIATLECSRRNLPDRAFEACLRSKGVR